MSENTTTALSEEVHEDSEQTSAGSFENIFLALLKPLSNQIRELDRKLDQQRDARSEKPNETDANQPVKKVLAEAPSLQSLLDFERENLKKIGGYIAKYGDRTDEKLDRLTSQFSSDFAKLRLSVDHLAAVPEPTSAMNGDEVAKLVLGPHLAGNSSIADARAQLMQAVANGDQAAQILAGRILTAQGSSPEQLTTLLGEIGEAYYAWRPKKKNVADPLELELSRWIDQQCRERSLQNSVGLVSIGEPFESRRHISDQRGGYITAVLGWIVLRDNGSAVYSRAKVLAG
jgi:hypothetical protein